MRIISAKINIKKNVIVLRNDMLEEYEFNMNERKTLPQWAEKELGKLHFLNKTGNWMFFTP